MSDTVKLIGLDFGTTTSSAVIASAQIRRTATGRMTIEHQEEIFRSELVFTPTIVSPLFPGEGSGVRERLDLDKVEILLDSWLAAGKVQLSELFGGGALLTGLTAQKDNAAGLVAMIRRRLGDALVATADDPCLESWLAFMGGCAPLSRKHPDRFILNLDIGGGTTNIALGKDRQVSRTGCLFLGARHVQVIPGSYRIINLSPYARELFAHLGIAKGPGDDLHPSEVDAVVAYYLLLLERICTGKPFGDAMASRLEQVHFQMPADVCDSIVTFSGGVGELIYRCQQGDSWPATTCFGDLGIDLAQRIVASPLWADSLRAFRPASAGRATVYGLLRNATEVSGNTLFLAAPDILPLTDVPILGRLNADSSEAQVRDVMALVRQSGRGGAMQVRLGSQGIEAVHALGERFASLLERDAFPATHPLVLLVEENLGKVLGHYVTRWGALPCRLLVIDEVAQRDAQYVQIGSPRDQVVPVSFYGILPEGDVS